MSNVPEFWTDESEPNQQIFYHVCGDKIFQTEEGYEYHWDLSGEIVITKHKTLEEAFVATAPEGEE